MPLRILQFMALGAMLFCGPRTSGVILQENLHIDGLCVFDTDKLEEPLYSFPADKRSSNLFHEFLTSSGKELSFTVKAANVPEVVAAEKGNERLLLYNQYTLEKFEQSGRRDWRIAIVIAHQLGHLASQHSFGFEPRLRTEIELEADRFAGYLLFQMGAGKDDLQAASERFANVAANRGYPDRLGRVTAIAEGWHAAKAEVGGGSGFEGETNIPGFPAWPPPLASANMDIPRKILVKANNRPRLMDIATRLVNALDEAGYGEKSFYSAPDGFAIASRIEQIYPDGRPKEGDARWPTDISPPRIFSITSYVRALFSRSPGLYRVMVFVVTNRPLTQSGPISKHSSPRDWAWSGANKLPTAIGFVDYTTEFSCTVLIYEFEQPATGMEATLSLPSKLIGRTHLERSSILSKLEH
jgi:hypothetical protein